MTRPNHTESFETNPPEFTADHCWAGLYRAGGVAALITAVLIPIQLTFFIAWPPPLTGTVIDWFTVFEGSRLLGLLSLDLLLMVVYALLVPIVLALYAALRDTGRGLMAAGSALFFVSIASYFASNTAVEMLALSGQHAAATTDAQRAMFQAAGQGMLTTYTGTAFHVSYILGSIAGILLMIPVLSCKRRIFGKTTAYFGIAGNALGFGLYVPQIGIPLSAASGAVLWIWYILVARGFLRLVRGNGAGAPYPHASASWPARTFSAT
jgi:hypothetical protein